MVQSSFVVDAYASLTALPLSSLLFIIAAICVGTRLWTGILSSRQAELKEGPKIVPLLPYWIPWLGHTLHFVTRPKSFLIDARNATTDGVFRLCLAGTRHNVVISPSLTKQVYLQRPDVVTIDDLLLRVLENVVGDNGAIRNHEPSLVKHSGRLYQLVYALNREPFVSEAAAYTIKAVENRIHNLVSFSSSIVDQSSWERMADARLGPSGRSVEVSFNLLIRHFVGDIVSTALMGQEFMDNNPSILSDLFTVDGSFNELFAGLPWWFPGMAPTYRARKRVVEAFREHQAALFAVLEDRDPGNGWNDLSDVSNVMQDRARAWQEMAIDRDISSRSDVILLFAMNANANQVIFWMLWYIYQRPELRSKIMSEIGPFVYLTQRKSSELAIQELPRLTIELAGLVHKCPFFKATFYETMRLEAPITNYKTVLQTFDVTESIDDASHNGRTDPQTYRFEQGSYICLPLGSHVTDERYWKNPTDFDPQRFLTRTEKEGVEGGSAHQVPDMGTMRPFGGGATMCKGRAFAEREILIFCAAILTCWDVEPVTGSQWPDPSRKISGGANHAKSDVRVRLSRRLSGDKGLAP